jgi:hypothetical protein
MAFLEADSFLCKAFGAQILDRVAALASQGSGLGESPYALLNGHASVLLFKRVRSTILR